jgi:hypothetical protein
MLPIVLKLYSLMKLQPIRIEAGWQVTYNQLYEVDPVAGNEHFFEGSSLLMLQNDARLKLIDVSWRPERDLSGAYRVAVLNFLETHNPKTNDFDIAPDWEHPYASFSTKLRIELVEKLEELMRTLPIYKDPRIVSKRGIVAHPSEEYRLALQETGLTDELIANILKNGNAKIQHLVLAHKDVTREIILRFAENGLSKKVKNRAKEKLGNKRFKR